MALRNGDVITLCNETDRFLASDTTGLCGSSATGGEKVLLSAAGRLSSGETVYPASFETRCLFRIAGGRAPAASTTGDIVYGQAFLLIHVATEMALVAISQEEVELQQVEVDGMGALRAHAV